MLLRWPVIAVAAVALVALVAWLWLPRGAADPAEAAGDVMTDDVIAGPPPLDSAPPPAPAPAPPAPEPTEDPRATTQPYATLPSDFGTADLEALRASDAFEVFAEWDRAITVEYSQLAAGNFAPQENDEVLYEWDNVEDLWNSIAPVIRDDALLAGPEWTEPLWDNVEIVTAHVAVPWNNETTQGRGDVIRFEVVLDRANAAVLRSYVVLIATDQVEGRQIGYVNARMPAFDYREVDFASAAELRTASLDRIWEWVQAQAPVEDGT